jgi:sporulation protein YlmC with PRC-barrel domain
MAGMTPFTIGADVSCSDGICGKVSRLVMDPRAGTVTHLVVNDRQFQGRLVPLNLVDADATTGEIRLRCTIAEFGKLHPASRTVPLEGSGADPDVRDQDQVQLRSMASTYLADPPSITYDTLPPGEVAVRGGEHVHATDGNIGQIQGLVIDSGSCQVITHVLLREGHVFGRKVVAIPFGAVTAVSQDGIQLKITKQQVKDLPSGWHRSPGLVACSAPEPHRFGETQAGRPQHPLA